MSTAPDPKTLAYPAKDYNGYAKKRYAGQEYSFGKHNTDESFALFGRWRAELIETGNPPDLSLLKREIKVTDEEEQPSAWKPLALRITAACVAIAIISSATTYGLLSHGLPTADEKIILRGLRTHEATLSGRESLKQTSSTAATFAAIQDGTYVRRNKRQNGDLGQRGAGVGLLAGGDSDRARGSE